MYKLLTSLILILLSTFSVSTTQDPRDDISDALKNVYHNIQITPPYKSEDIENDFVDTIGVTPSLKPWKYEVKEQPTPNDNGKTKVEAYNIKSAKSVGQVSVSAVEHSEVLLPCSQNPSNCSNVTQSPTPTAGHTPTPNPTPTITLPTPKPPLPTPICKYKTEIACRLVECPDLAVEDVENICGCPCVPPPIY